MNPLTSSAFDLPPRRAGKADPRLVADDDRHFAAVAAALAEALADLEARLGSLRRTPGRIGQEVMDRDLEVHRLSARLRTLRRFSIDMCIGRVVGDGARDRIYVARLGLADRSGRRLLVDWRSPAAEPFFAATHADPMGLVSRRRYRWSHGRIVDYWDEAFTPDGLESDASLDAHSAFVASLGSSGSPKMRDVLATIQSDQDAIIRAGSRGALVVDGGPGTGKTVVALHRAAYLLYADPRLGADRGGVLFVGPHEPYLDFVVDVLPSLGEEGVRTCTLRDLVAEGAAAGIEADPDVARLKASAAMTDVIDEAVRFYEEPPAAGMTVSTEWSDTWLSADDWAAAFDAAEPGTPHNVARDDVWETLVGILVAKDDSGAPADAVRRSFRASEDLLTAFGGAWPRIDAADLVADLWSVPAYLRRCAPWLHPEEVRLLQRADARAWTVSDLPLLDAARARLGDPHESARRRRAEAAVAAEHAAMDRVVDELLQADDDGMLAQLRQPGLRDVLVDAAALPSASADRLAGPFAHVIVDEAQDLTDAQWQMLLRRCPSRSLTIVGDRAQARNGFVESWSERLERIGLTRITVSSLTVNYRTPTEVMVEAEPVIRAMLPDANVPTSIRSSGLPVIRGTVIELRSTVDSWLRRHPEGTVAVIGDASFASTPRVRSLTPDLVRGLEFDLVVLVAPESLGDGVAGAVDRYVAMTRTTMQLAVLVG